MIATQPQHLCVHLRGLTPRCFRIKGAKGVPYFFARRTVQNCIHGPAAWRRRKSTPPPLPNVPHGSRGTPNPSTQSLCTRCAVGPVILQKLCNIPFVLLFVWPTIMCPPDIHEKPFCIGGGGTRQVSRSPSPAAPDIPRGKKPMALPPRAFSLLERGLALSRCPDPVAHPPRTVTPPAVTEGPGAGRALWPLSVVPSLVGVVLVRAQLAAGSLLCVTHLSRRGGYPLLPSHPWPSLLGWRAIRSTGGLGTSAHQQPGLVGIQTPGPNLCGTSHRLSTAGVRAGSIPPPGPLPTAHSPARPSPEPSAFSLALGCPPNLTMGGPWICFLVPHPQPHCLQCRTDKKGTEEKFELALNYD